MHILFVWLNNDSPLGCSHGLAVLSAELKSRGHRVELCHVNERLGMPLDLLALRRRLRASSPDLVGLSFGSNHADVAKRVAAATREALPGCWLVAGGIHATMYPDQVAAWPGVDVVGVGEVDGFRFADFIAELEAGRMPRDWPGFWVKRLGLVHQNPLGPPVDLSGSMPMDLELFDHRQILRLKRGWADVHAGRGCPRRCSYCFNQSLRQRYLADLRLARPSELDYVRRRPVDVVLAELSRYLELYGDQVRVFSFTDDQFASDRRWLFEFLERYRQQFAVPLIFLSSPEEIDREVAERCRRAGVYMVRFGIETGSVRLRERVLRRRTSTAAIYRAVSTLQEAGINAFSFNMLGIPTETPRDLWGTFRLLGDVRCDAVKFSIFWPYPGTPLYQRCHEEGLIREDLGFIGNNIEHSPLLWPSPRQRFYGRISRFYDLALNRCLVARRQRDYSRLLAELRTLSDAAWEDGGAQDLRERTNQLNADVLAQGQPAYTLPFPDRCDIALLQSKERTRPLLVG